MASNSITHQLIINTSHHTIKTKRIISVTLLHRLLLYKHTSPFNSLHLTTLKMQFSTLTSILLLAIPTIVSAVPVAEANAIFARGKATKALESFINEIPDSKLSDLPTQGGTIYKDTDFRLDMQGVC